MPLFHDPTPSPAASDANRPAQMPQPHMPQPLSTRQPAPTPPPVAGTGASTLLKRYRPLETRASGGFGSVEICLDSRLQRRVAIKRMPLASPYNRATTETVSAALAEARTASMLQHPNIVSVIDFTYDAAYAYLVMEYVDGMNLEEFLAQVEGHSLTYDEAAAIADALVQALAYAHENGVLHLDIKPANVLITHNGHIKLADFGMATLTSAAGFGGARGGTIGYMAPEQLNGAEVDERSDIFSLAAVLYESLCATAPFRAGTPADSLKNIEKGVLYPSDLLPDIPEATEDALLSALSPLASDRMRSVSAFGDQFLKHLGNPREGRKSLARIVNRLTSDEEEGEDPENTGQTGRVWELDPAEGYLGSRTDRARQAVLGAISGISVAYVSYMLLGLMNVGSPLVQGITAVGIGIAAALAPQIGSALAVAGFIMLIANATPVLPVLPVVIVSFAFTAAWWFVWGRLQPAASAAFTFALALVLASGNAVLCAPLVAVAAAYFLPAGSAAVSTAFGLAQAQLFLAAQAGGGALPIESALTWLGSLSFLLPAVGASAVAALASWALDRAWQAYREARSRGILALAYALPPVAAPALLCLAHTVEITNVPPVEIAAAAAMGGLSSIILFVCVYALGYRRDYAEGDLS